MDQLPRQKQETNRWRQKTGLAIGGLAITVTLGVGLFTEKINSGFKAVLQEVLPPDDTVKKRQPGPDDICTITPVGKTTLYSADIYAEGYDEIWGAQAKIAKALKETDTPDHFAVCFSPDYPGSHNQIMLPQNVRSLPAHQIVSPHDYPGQTSVG